MTKKLPVRRIEPSVHGPALDPVTPAEAQPGNATSLSIVAAPLVAGVGLAFSIEDLVLVRDWAERRGLRLTVQLDHRENGASYEEMLSLTPRGHAIRCLTLWRQSEAVALKTVAGHARLYHTVLEALQHWEAEGGGRMLRLSAWISPLLARRSRRLGPGT